MFPAPNCCAMTATVPLLIPFTNTSGTVITSDAIVTPEIVSSASRGSLS